MTIATDIAATSFLFYFAWQKIANLLEINE